MFVEIVSAQETKYHESINVELKELRHQLDAERVKKVQVSLS